MPKEAGSRAMTKYEPPTFQKANFHCPHCGVHARQYWKYVFFYHNLTPAHAEYQTSIKLNFCNNCDKLSIWFEGKMIYPLASSAPMPVDEMPDDVKQDYFEARNIVVQSPRAAAALLRLALQKLMPHLGKSGKNLNADIAELVKDGLPQKIQKALDSLRVIGNNAVHPGQIDLKDDTATPTALFELLNMIVDVMIAQPKRVDAIYEKVPDSAKEAIQKRDRPVGGS